jgi:hypothetical protein
VEFRILKEILGFRKEREKYWPIPNKILREINSFQHGMFESHLQIVEYKFITKFEIQNLDFKIKRKQKKKKKKKEREETPPGPRKPFSGPTQNHSCAAHLMCEHHSTDGWGPLAVSWIIAAGVGWSLQRAPTYADGTRCINNAPLGALTPSNEPKPHTTVDC